LTGTNENKQQNYYDKNAKQVHLVELKSGLDVRHDIRPEKPSFKMYKKDKMHMIKSLKCSNTRTVKKLSIVYL